MKKWEDVKKSITSMTEDEKAVNSRMAKAVHDGWLTDEQAWWILFGEELEDDN